MKYQINLTVILFLLLSVSSYSYSEENLRIGEARTLSLGEERATLSSLFNPSLLSLESKRSFSIHYFNRYGMKEMGTAGLSFLYPNRFLSAGLNIASFGYSKYRESMGRIGLSKRLFGFMTAGVAVQYYFIQSDLYEETLQRISTDVGVTIKPVQNLLIGLFINDMPSFVLGEEIVENNSFKSKSMGIGFQWQVINMLLISAGCNIDEEKEINTSVGIEYYLHERFAIRGGIRSNPFVPSLGAGVNVSFFTVDAAALWHPVLGISSSIGLIFTF